MPARAPLARKPYRRIWGTTSYAGGAPFADDLSTGGEMNSAVKNLWNNFELYVANISLALMVAMLALQAVARYIL